jgi:hypothetical protein
MGTVPVKVMSRAVMLVTPDGMGSSVEFKVTVEPAWLGVPNAKLAMSPRAAIKKNDRLLIEYLRRSKISLGKVEALEFELRRTVITISNSFPIGL